ncbi:MAG: rubrerythrin family protein [Bacillota bacterium]|jgi:rubrerythrin
MSVQNAMTADFLRSAYGGESMAHMRYLAWGDLAEKDGFPKISKLFKAISYAEQVHAHNHFRELQTQQGDYTVAAGAVFGIGSLVDNLQGAINGELHEVEQMYPVYLQTARFQGEKGAGRSFHFALEAEKIHADLFQKAQDAAREGQDLQINSVHICPICGHTVVDGIPDKCPVCGAKKDQYVTF